MVYSMYSLTGLPDDAGVFIDGAFRALPGDPTIPLFLARFRTPAFRPALFDTFDIARPATIAASVPKRQAEFLAGRICARAALQRAGHAAAQVPVGPQRAPQWPAGAKGSITHNACFAAAAVSADGSTLGIGVDIETLIDGATGGQVASQVASAAELARLHAPTAGPDAQARLTLIFSAKESFFKAAYAQVGDYFGFDAVELLAFDPAAARLQFRCVQALGPALAAGTRFDAHYEQLDAATVLTAVVLR